MSCPICCKASIPSYHPFCSKRCSMVDLGHWLGERYTIPVEDEEDSQENPS